MNNETTPEQKIEAAFLQFIKIVATMRRKQQQFDTHFGSENRRFKIKYQQRVDEALATMGIDTETDLNELVGLKLEGEGV